MCSASLPSLRRAWICRWRPCLVVDARAYPKVHGHAVSKVSFVRAQWDVILGLVLEQNCMACRGPRWAPWGSVPVPRNWDTLLAGFPGIHENQLGEADAAEPVISRGPDQLCVRFRPRVAVAGHGRRSSRGDRFDPSRLTSGSGSGAGRQCAVAPVAVLCR